MISVLIDTRQIVEDFNMDQGDINTLMDNTIKDLTARFAQEWENEANRTLKTSRQEYIANINVVDEGFARGAVVLTGWLPNAVEQGKDGFDMKEGLLDGPNAKIGKDGTRYNTVPYSFGVPTSLPENFTGGILPVEVHEIVKAKQPNQPVMLKELPEQFQVKKVKVTPIGDYTHKNSIYEGISKRTDIKTGQNTYGSFRRVSDNSDPASWIHPGIQAQEIADRVLASFDIPNEVGRILDSYL